MVKFEKKNYINSMRHSVGLLNLLYNDGYKDKDIEYEPNGTDDAPAEYDILDKTVYAHDGSLLSAFDLFYGLLHEGLHAWDDLNGHYDTWRSKDESLRKSIAETRAYEIAIYYGCDYTPNQLKKYERFKKEADGNTFFPNFRILSYDVFFINISNPNRTIKK